MRSQAVVIDQGTGTSTPVDADATPFHAGSQVVVSIDVSRAGTAGGRGWTIEGNNQPEGATAVWEALTTEVSDSNGRWFTISMPRQIRLNATTAGAGTKTASAHLLGST